jgi:exopolysaccharide biosynthesis polyprenyl glycosylphosphotransferase
MDLASTSALPSLASAAADSASRIASARSAPAACTPAIGARRVPAARVVAAADVGLVMTALMIAAAGPIDERWPAGVVGLLSARIHVYDAALLVGLAAAVFLVFERAGLYDASRLRRGLDEAARVALAVAAVVGITAVALVSSHSDLLDASTMLRFLVIGFGFAAAARVLRARLSRSAAAHRRVLIVGSGPHARRICRELSANPRTRYQVLGFVDTHDEVRSSYIARRTLGSLEELERILVSEHVDEVHVGLPVKSHYPQIQESIRICERIGVKATYDADIFRTELARPRVEHVAGPRPQVEMQVVAEGWPLSVKRVVDVLGAALALIALAPLMLAAALAIKLTSPGPVIFAQERYGLNRRRFRMLKFRTMVNGAERLQAALESRNEAAGPVFKIANDPRITRLGRWLRRTSIDELPQLFNVLRGDMSLVGPRPLPVRDVKQISRTTDMRRFSVRPGVTGLWQVSGRSALAFDQWVALDLHYIDHWSLGLDALILARTVPAVLRGTGAA